MALARLRDVLVPDGRLYVDGGDPLREVPLPVAAAAPAEGLSFDELVDALRSLTGLRDKGKQHPHFHHRSRPFLHFHALDAGTYADVRFGNDFERVPASTAAERAALLERVRAHLAAGAATRR